MKICTLEKDLVPISFSHYCWKTFEEYLNDEKDCFGYSSPHPNLFVKENKEQFESMPRSEFIRTHMPKCKECREEIKAAQEGQDILIRVTAIDFLNDADVIRIAHLKKQIPPVTISREKFGAHIKRCKKCQQALKIVKRELKKEEQNRIDAKKLKNLREITGFYDDWCC